MYRECTVKDYDKLMNYLEKDAVIHTFIISDIEIYGFDKPYQKVYINEDENNICKSVILRYYNNLIISGEDKWIDIEFIEKIIISQGIKNIMGSADLVKKLYDSNQEAYIYSEKLFYTMSNDLKLKDCSDVSKAELGDADDIYNFLMSIDEIKGMYSEKSMLLNRISSNEGEHFYLKDGDRIIAHANSAATTKYTSIIGGISVAKDLRGNGYGKKIVSAVCKSIVEKSITPCTFGPSYEEHNLLIDIGFRPYKKWATMAVK